MAILMIVVAPKFTKENYELLRKEVDWEHKQPDGMIFHAASFDGAGGIHVADVWESQQAVDKFFDERLIPGMKKLNILPTMSKEIYPLHAAVAHEGVMQYRAKAAR